jgi:hypothetical protein
MKTTRFVKYGNITVAISADETMAVFFCNGIKRRVSIDRDSVQPIFQILDEILGSSSRTSVKRLGVTVNDSTSVKFDDDETQLIA